MLWSASMSEWKPDWSVPPGEILAEELTARGIAWDHAAAELGIHRAQLTLLVTGKKQIDSTIAVRLEKLTGISSTLWLGLEDRHQEWMRDNQMVALLQANSAVMANPEYERPRGALALAPTHSGAFLLTELNKAGWKLVKDA